MFSKWKSACLIILIGAFFTTCQYRQILKSGNLDLKYEAAINYYENGDYYKAYPLLEELIAIYRGTSKAEKLFYYYAYCDYNLGDFYLANYRFKNFSKTYPNSEFAEECYFMAAYCHYRNSPKYSLDQTDTYSAINSLQLFVNRYPESKLADSCNVLVDKLRAKLERKFFEISNQYYHKRNYKAAIRSFENTLLDFPDTKYREEIMSFILKSNYELAKNSILAKKEKRFEDTIKSYVKFADSFPKSKFMKEAEAMYEDALKEKQKIENQKVLSNGL
ncbi:MAG: outer membrane protein assembly factor BamD [Flavobacteriales bacterium]|nr:MAG: outer membrane protein assembly factor BamD [Flavobacteriales bacterium]